MLGEPSELKCNVFIETDGRPFPVASVLELMGRRREQVPVIGPWAFWVLCCGGCAVRWAMAFVSLSQNLLF